MSDYTDMPLGDFVLLATNSSPELGALSDGEMIDYETGQRFVVPDETTALFLASARNIVLELVKRVQILECD